MLFDNPPIFSPLLVGYECWRKFFDSLDFKTVNYPGGAVVGLVDQQPKRTAKKLQLKIVPFINGNISHILDSIYIATMLEFQPSHQPVFIIQALMNVIG